MKRTTTLFRSGLRLGLMVLLAAAASPGRANVVECLMQPTQTVELRSSVEGIIQRIHVQRGDDVRIGQILVELESSAERSAVEVTRYRATLEGRIGASRNRMDFASKKLDLSRELHSRNFVAAQARDEAETERRLTESEHKEALEEQELAKLEYRRAIDLLNRRILRSPLNGVVVDRMLNPGDLAESGTGPKPVLKLAQIDPLRVEVVLPLAAYGKLKPGMVAQVVPDGLGGQYPATVKIVDRVFDAASGTFGVRLEMPNPKGRLPGGIHCQVDFPQLKDLAIKPRPSR